MPPPPKPTGTTHIVVELDMLGNPVHPMYQCGRPFWPHTAKFGTTSNSGVFVQLEWQFAYGNDTPVGFDGPTVAPKTIAPKALKKN